MGDTKDPTNCNFHREHFKNSTGVSGYSLGFSGTKPKSCCFSFPIFITVYIYIYDIYIILVGGFKHLLFSILYGMSSFPLTLIFFKMVKTTNQYIYIIMIIYIYINYIPIISITLKLLVFPNGPALRLAVIYFCLTGRVLEWKQVLKPLKRQAARAASPFGGFEKSRDDMIHHDTVDGCEILHHHLGWNPINNGMFTTYELAIRISQPSTVWHELGQRCTL